VCRNLRRYHELPLHVADVNSSCDACCSRLSKSFIESAESHRQTLCATRGVLSVAR
jgi:hypothetical protein